MKHIKTLLLTSAAAGLVASVSAEQMQILSPQTSGAYSAISVAGTEFSAMPSGTWNFDIGYFNALFDASTGNWDQWEANFSSFITTEWRHPENFAPFLANKVDVTFGMTDASFSGQTGVVWGYNSKAIEGTSEWIAISNENWIFPVPNPVSTEPTAANTWNLSDPNNIVLTGSFQEGSPANGFQTQAIPEPSTYALMFGLGIFGLIAYRRFRK